MMANFVEYGKKLCEAFGLNPSTVTKLVIEIGLKPPVKVTVSLLPTAEQMEWLTENPPPDVEFVKE